MKATIEGYTFDFPTAESIVKFDGPEHRMASAMKAVDVVIELPDKRIYIEVKDYATNWDRVLQDWEAKKITRKEWLRRLRFSLIYKFRDSLLYHWCQKKTEKRNIFVFLTEWADSILLNALKENLASGFPTLNKSGACAQVWQRSFVDTHVVLDDSLWNRIPSLRAMGSIHKVTPPAQPSAL